MDQLEEFHYFTTPVYAVKKPEFLEPIRNVSKKYLDKSKSRIAKNKNPMMVMTTNFSLDPDASEFAQYVSQTAWNILNAQGYNMDNLVTFFTEMWTQEHNFHSSMDTHVHGGGSQISAFYFLDVPENSCKMVIHDPRAGKVMINLPQKDANAVTPASERIVFAPEAGALIMCPAWLPHQFTRNLNKTKPVHFVHMNIAVTHAPEQQQEPNVEII
jgi:uncharacterized protein (TIGR02466 family)